VLGIVVLGIWLCFLLIFWQLFGIVAVLFGQGLGLGIVVEIVFGIVFGLVLGVWLRFLLIFWRLFGIVAGLCVCVGGGGVAGLCRYWFGDCVGIVCGLLGNNMGIVWEDHLGLLADCGGFT